MDISNGMHLRVFAELFTVVALLSIVANSFLIFVILKYKKLRDDTTNKLFLHFNILQIVILIASPLGILLEAYSVDLQFEFMCGFLIIVFSALFGLLEIIWLLIFDSYIKFYCNNKYERFGSVCKYVLVVIYILTVITPFPAIPWVTANPAGIGLFYYVMVPGVALLALVLIIINVIHAIRKRKLTNYKSSNIGLVIPNIFFLVLCPSLIIFLCLILLDLEAPSIIQILCLLVYANPIYNFFYVYFFDSDYKVFLKLSFTCKSGEYDSVNLEDQSVTYHDAKESVLHTQ
ncbi:hypothetical protein TcasGA2_TC033099 [Tribolium castaneum]|uniref:G-protein coupled receptors family 1 profile domain-containing protein n=1 Tax=Tribolium castaneum TaxID=7070 RepID=A0A139WID0_TRICA|nr:hypothetical protein TcasGA2_TC033099 [Tribolium castaneum]